MKRVATVNYDRKHKKMFQPNWEGEVDESLMDLTLKLNKKIDKKMKSRFSNPQIIRIFWFCIITTLLIKIAIIFLLNFGKNEIVSWLISLVIFLWIFIIYKLDKMERKSRHELQRMIYENYSSLMKVVKDSNLYFEPNYNRIMIYDANKFITSNQVFNDISNVSDNAFLSNIFEGMQNIIDNVSSQDQEGPHISSVESE